MTEYQLPMLLSSDPANGAQQLIKNGSRFTVILERPIIIPPEAKTCWITASQANIVFNNPNILTGINDQLLVEYDDGIIQAQYPITIEKGLWDIDHLNSAIQTQLANYGIAKDAITLYPETATQKTVILFKKYFQIDFTGNQTFREILGFNSRIAPVGGYPANDIYESSDNVAKFNTILYYLVHCDLASGFALSVNGQYDNTILKVPITVSAGSLINFEKQNLDYLPTPGLIGQSLREIHAWLTDDQGQFVDTLGEYWSVSLSIHYTL